MTPARPSRLHHRATVCRDQEATRAFYEGILGLPLVATWAEDDELGTYCHTFFELADGSCLAFFQFSDPEVTEHHAAQASKSPFDHVALAVTTALQQQVHERASARGVDTITVDHGYCVSMYLRDPDGMVVELTADDPRALADAAVRRAKAREDLDRWLAGDHATNNAYRMAVPPAD